MSKSAYKKKKKGSSPAVNFACMLLGMMTTTVLLLWGYQQVFAQPIEGTSTSELREEDPNARKQSTSIKDDELDQASADELFVFLKDLEKWPRKAETPVKIEYQNRAIAVSNKLLATEGISKTKRDYAILSRIRAYTALYGLAIFSPELLTPELVDAMEKSSLPFVDSEEPEINRAALSAMIKLSAFEFILHDDKSYSEKLESNLDTILERHSEHPATSVTVARVLNELAEHDSEYSTRLIEKTANVYEAAENSAVNRVGTNLRETILLTNTNLESLFRDRYVNGLQSQKDLYDATAKLIAAEELGPTGMSVVSHTMNWFEEVKRGKAVTNLATRLLNAADNKEPESFRTQMQLTAKSFITRQNLLGQSFVFSGEKIDHDFLDPEEYKERVTVLAFVRSPHEPSRKFMLRLSRHANIFASKSIRVMIVMPENELGYEEFIDDKKRDNWDFVIGEKEGTGGVSIFGQHPVTMFPSLTLIDHEGKVYRINTPFQQLNHEMEYLVGRQRKAAGSKTEMK